MAINDDKWKILFGRYDIISVVNREGFFDITADQIREVREPRLMCKMDFKQSVAKPFKDSGLSILAIQNGVYRIAKISPFFEIDIDLVNNIDPMDFKLPEYLETLNFENITGESQALDAAVASGMLRHLLEEETFLTVRGRRYSTSMNIEIAEATTNRIITYPVKSVQIEVDGGYEGRSQLVLIEAKMGTADNMNMRQLIYPHVHFQTLTEKTVKTFVMFYETGSVFTFIPMTYEGGTPRLAYDDASKYRLVSSIEKTTIDPVINNRLPKIDYEAPFPQADDFSKIIYGLLKLSEIQPASKQELFGNFPIHPRQYDYYYNAIRWLGLAERDPATGDCVLTNGGEYLVSITEEKRLAGLRSVMLSDELFAMIDAGATSTATKEQLAKRKMSLKTFQGRRIKTVQSWLRATEHAQMNLIGV